MPEWEVILLRDSLPKFPSQDKRGRDLTPNLLCSSAGRRPLKLLMVGQLAVLNTLEILEGGVFSNINNLVLRP